MPARVGKCVGAVRCQSGRVASHVRGMWVALRGSGLQISALAMRHNVPGIGVVVALMNFLSQSALQAWDVGGWRGLFCSLSVETKFCNLKTIYTFVSLSDMKKLKTLHPFTLPLVVISTVGQPL
jgi:hypothetical protein